MGLSLYGVTPRFRARLRPFVGRLAAAGATANQATFVAAALSAAVGAFALANAPACWPFALIPLWAFVRMPGAPGPMVRASRRWGRPTCKSGRALVFGAPGLWTRPSPAPRDAAFPATPAIAIGVIVVNRAGHGVAEVSAKARRRD